MASNLKIASVSLSDPPGPLKGTDLSLVLAALKSMEPGVTVPEEIAIRARRAIERMLAVRV